MCTLIKLESSCKKTNNTNSRYHFGTKNNSNDNSCNYKSNIEPSPNIRRERIPYMQRTYLLYIHTSITHRLTFRHTPHAYSLHHQPTYSHIHMHAQYRNSYGTNWPGMNDSNINKQDRTKIILTCVCLNGIYIRKPGNAVSIGIRLSGLQKCKHSSWNFFPIGLNGFNTGQNEI